MDTKQRIELTRSQIVQALNDYGEFNYGHTFRGFQSNDNLDFAEPGKRDEDIRWEYVGKDFLDRLARESVEAKQPLRELLSKHPDWDEELDAVRLTYNIIIDPNINEAMTALRGIIRGRDPRTLPKDMDPLARAYLTLLLSMDGGMGIESLIGTLVYPVIQYHDPFIHRQNLPVTTQRVVDMMDPTILTEGRRTTRCIQDILKKFKLYSAEAGSDYQKQFAALTDSLKDQQHSYPMYLSINPAHFLTMSNPKDDVRGRMMTTCHSLDSKYHYRAGCVGYARDSSAMILFTTNEDTTQVQNSRKTSRQMFFYEPQNLVILQSRLYNAISPNYDEQIRSDYLQYMLELIAQVENVSTEWVVRALGSSMESSLIKMNPHFGGYKDWRFDSSRPQVAFHKEIGVSNWGNNSLEEMRKHQLHIGAPGLCFVCGADTRYGLDCHEHSVDEADCVWCGESNYAIDMYELETGEWICIEDCNNEAAWTCPICGCEYRSGARRLVDDRYMCADCAEQLMSEQSTAGDAA